MQAHSQLKERTPIVGELFPFNVFHQRRKNKYQIIRPHWQEIDEIIIMLSGNASFQIGSQFVEASPDDIFFINSGQLHTAYTDDDYVEFIALVFDKSMLAKSGSEGDFARHISPYLRDEVIPYTKIPRNLPEVHEEIRGRIQQIAIEFKAKKSGMEWLIKTHLQVIIMLLSRENLLYKNDKIGITSRKLARFTDLFSFLDNHYFDKIAIEDAAKITNMSPYYFCTVFKRVTGLTFNDYLHTCRVNEAEELLRKSDLTVTEIAERVGYSNINHFDKIFKKYKSLSPSQYRKQFGS